MLSTTTDSTNKDKPLITMPLRIDSSIISSSGGSGQHRLEYYSSDKLNNRSSIGSITFTVSPKVFFGINHMDKILSTKESGIRWGLRNQPEDKRIILREIKEMGFNTIRLPLYWEGFLYYKRRGEASVAVYVNRLKEVAQIADDLNMYIIYDNHHWGGSSYLKHHNAEGIGFPAACMQALGIQKDADYPSVSELFWSNFLNNYRCSIDGVDKPVWEHLWDYFSIVVENTKDYKSTLGYEVMNEPFTYYSRYTLAEVKKLGNFYTYMAERIRALTSSSSSSSSSSMKKLIFVQFPLGASASRSADFAPYNNKEEAAYYEAYPRRNGGSNERMDGIVWAFTFYSGQTPTTGSAREVAQFTNIKNIATRHNVQIFVSEWDVKPAEGELIPEAAKAYMQTFKELGWWHTFFSYDPSAHGIKDTKYNDVYNSSRTMTYKQMLIDAVKAVYG
ncbi:MAG: cellulase family glycosylhydrolase [Candidatus Nitrosocaldaceae archaeon]